MHKSSSRTTSDAENTLRSDGNDSVEEYKRDPSNIYSLASPIKAASKNLPSHSPSLLKSPPLRTPAQTSLLKSPVRASPGASNRRSPRLLSKLVQNMGGKPSPALDQKSCDDTNPFMESDRIISSSPQKSRGNNSVNSCADQSGSIPVLLPTGKTPRATKSIVFSSASDEEEDENNLNLSNTQELFSPGFHGEFHQLHMHYSKIPCGTSNVETESNFPTPSQCELEFYQSEEYQESIAFIASLPESSSLSPHTYHRNVHVLPPLEADSATKLTLVLDLDETLVHCSDEPMDPFDISFALSIPGRQQPLEVFVRWRPHLFSFLEELKKRSQAIDVVLFTASQKIYARRVLSLMDPNNEIFKHALFRESCRFLEGSFVKDLEILGRPLSNTILVDNSIQAYGLQPENGYAIPSWFDDPNDDELPRLLSFIDQLILLAETFPAHIDFRQVIRKRFPIYKSVLAYKESQDTEFPLAVESFVQLAV